MSSASSGGAPSTVTEGSVVVDVGGKVGATITRGREVEVEGTVGAGTEVSTGGAVREHAAASTASATTNPERRRRIFGMVPRLRRRRPERQAAEWRPAKSAKKSATSENTCVHENPSNPASRAGPYRAVDSLGSSTAITP